MAGEGSAIRRDGELHAEVKHSPSDAELLAAAVKLSGLSSAKLGLDYLHHGKAGRYITMADYVQFQLWDKARHGEFGAERFVGDSGHWPIVNAINKLAWRDVAEDKAVMHNMLKAAGLAHPETVAVIDRSIRTYPGLRQIQAAEELREIVRQYPDGGLFLKTVAGMIGAGVMIVEASDESGLTTTGNGPMSYEAFLDDCIGDAAYLIQVRLDNHAALQPYCTGLTSIRFANFVDGDRILVPCVAMKLTTAGNIACAFWRKGNLTGEVDLATGKVLRIARRQGPTIEYFDQEYPDHPGLVGLQLPFWEEAVALNEAAARLFAPIPYQSTDIALTPDGPVLVESNYGGSFDILQNGTGRGLLTDEVAEWFRARGYDPSARSEKKKKFGLF